jgi:hypothetical protein
VCLPYDETKHDYQLPWHWPFARIHQIFVDSHSTNNWPILAHPEKSNADSPSVFYFPGCGSERLYSNIGLAPIALPYHQGGKVVLISPNS